MAPAILATAFVLAAAAQDWPRFRGPNGSGNAGRTGGPAVIDPGTARSWLVPVPAGNSSPVAARRRVFLTGADGAALVVLCLDIATGSVLWRREIPRDRVQPHHALNGPATPTPAADGERVYVFFPDSGLYALSAADGTVCWRRALGPFVNGHGMAASPILAGDSVVLLCDQVRGSFLIAVDRRTGNVRWRSDRGDGGPSYSTPVTGSNGEIIVLSSTRLDAYRPADGRLLWQLSGFPYRPNPSPTVLADGTIVAAAGQSYPDVALRQFPPFDDFLKAADHDRNGVISRSEAPKLPANLFVQIDGDGDGAITRSEYDAFLSLAFLPASVAAVRPPASPDVKPSVAWRHTRYAPECATPLAFEGAVYLVRKGGILTSLDARSGTVIKEGRVGAPGNYYASPVVAGGRIYLVNEHGEVTTVAASGGDWRVEAVNRLGEDGVMATPAFADGRLLIRTGSALHCFARP